jgi:hypothetical protein
MTAVWDLELRERLERIEEKLDRLLGQQPQLVDAARLAEMLGISRSTVYGLAADLGAVEVGSGSKPRLRFDVETARQAWTRRQASERSQQQETPVLAEVRRHRRRSGSGSGVDLLPVKPPAGGRAA